MKVTRSRRVVFNPQQYETVELLATVEQEFDPKVSPAEMSQHLDDVLDELLSAEVEEVAKVTKNPDSIVFDYRYHQ